MKKLFTFLMIVFTLPVFSTDVTFMVSMKGSGMDLSNGVFFAGGIYNGNSWEFHAMTDEGDSLYSVTITFNEKDTIGYYFITQDSWDNLDQFREPKLPETCDSHEFLGWNGDRGLIVPASDTTVAYVWGSCEEPVVTGIINKVPALNVIKLFPNPAEGNVTVAFPRTQQTVHIELFDISGKQLRVKKNYPVSGQIVLRTAALPRGLYIVKISNGDVTKISKLVLK